jgi:hypothetical protein
MKAHISHENIENYISQAQAARIRAVTRQAIADLIKRGRLSGVRLAGRTLVLRSEVETFIELAKGRPFKNATARKMSENICLERKQPRRRKSDHSHLARS